MAIAIGGNQINKAYLGTTEIQKMYLGSDLVFDNTAPTITLTPIMTNFRVLDGIANQVHFDTPLGPVTGLTTQGFTISGVVQITSVNTVDNYFTIGQGIDFWDNNTVRLEGGNGIVYDFTMEAISNDMDEPTASVDRFVTASGSGNGEDIGTPASLSYACTNAQGGQTWNIQKGNYGSSEFGLSNSGSSGSPIVFKGYNNTPGDLDNDYLVDTYTYGDGYDTSKWPVLVGNNPASNNYGLNLNGRQNVIIKNMQSIGHYYNFASVGSGSNIVYENCLGGEGFAGSGNNLGYAFFSGVGTSYNNIRAFKCIGYDCSSANIRLYGEFNAVLYCKVYTGVANNSDYLVNNYNSSNTIVKGCEGHMIDALGSIGHGFGVKNQNTTDISEYSLFSDNILYIDQGESFFLAHQGTSNCVMKRNKTYGQTNLGQEVTGYRTRAGAHDNVIEQNYIEYADSGLQIGNNSEDKPLASGLVSDNNIFRNNICKDVRYAVSVSARQATERYTLKDTHFYNNTFYNIGSALFEFYATDSFDDFIVENMTAQNNMFYGDGGVTEYAGNYSRTVGQTYNNYFNLGISVPSGTGNQSEDPVFNNTNEGGFIPTATLDTIDAPIISTIQRDYYNDERGLNNKTAMGGVKGPAELPVPDETPPTLDTITIEDAAPNNVVMVFDEIVSGTNIGFSLSGTTDTAFDSISGSGNTWTGTLINDAQNGEVITLNYSNGDFEDDNGNALESITNQSVTNNIGSASQHYSFDGSANSYFLTNFDPSGLSNQSHVIRFKSNGDGSGLLTLLSNGNANKIYIRRSSPNYWNFVLSDDASSTSITNGTWINDNQWHTLICTYSTTNGMSIDVDDVNVRSTSDTTFTGLTAVMDIVIGARGTTETWDGDMSDVQIYNRELTAGEKTALVTDLTNTPSGLVCNFAGQKATDWTDEVAGYVATNQGGVTLT